MDSANDYIRRKYMHMRPGRPLRDNYATARFARIRLAVLAFNIAASMALMAFAVMVFIK